jgi:GntR family transcriptional repressor for pyruvate dehydrogenase complex
MATSLTDATRGRILALIDGGSLPAGERLPGEHALAAAFGVSRPVVRQALARLRAEGRVVARQGAGNFVGEAPALRPVDFGPLHGIEDLRCFLEFRCSLEGECAALAAQCRDAKLRTAIATRRKQLEAAWSRGESGIDEDVAFHAAIAQATGNRFFILTLAALNEQKRIGIRFTRELSPQPLKARWDDIRAEHRAIDEAIARRDAAGAREAMTRHLRRGIARLFKRQ